MSAFDELLAFFESNAYMKTVVTVVVYGLLTALAVRLTRSLFKRLIARSHKSSTQLVFLQHAAVAVVVLVGVFNMAYQIKPMRSLVVSLITGSSVIAVAVAFASQEAVANIVSGVFLTIFKPFTIGDRIKLPEKGILGFVEDINMRHTVIRTFENSRVVLPNSIMNSAMLENYNLAHGPVCTFLEVGISYDSDIDLAKSIISDEIANHKDYVERRTQDEIESGRPAVSPAVTQLGDSAIVLRVGVWAENPGIGYTMCSDLRQSIKERFAREGVEIPYPHSVVKIIEEA